MNTTQSLTGSADEPNESVAASWLPESAGFSDADEFVAEPSGSVAYASPASRQRRLRPALAAALLALGLSAGLAGSAWAHQASSSPVASNAGGTVSTSGAASVLPANLAGGDDSEADDASGAHAG